jgi:predicted RecA/RadA family phage recombinase
MSMSVRVATVLGAAALLCTALHAPFVRAQAPVIAGPAAPTLEFVYEEVVTLAAAQTIGETPQGKRNIVPITGGTFQGPRLKGKILPGGWDWQLASPGGCFTIHADYMIQTDDGVIINVRNAGAKCKSTAGDQGALLTSPVFEAPKGKYDWLNGGVYVGTLEGTSLNGVPAVHIRFYKAQGAAPAGQ